MRAWRVFADELDQVTVLAVETAGLLNASRVEIDVEPLRGAKQALQIAAGVAAPTVSGGSFNTFTNYDSALMDVSPLAGNGTVLVQC